MIRKTRLLALAAAALLTLGVACTAAAIPAPRAPAPAALPSPTPIPPEAIETALTFARAHQQVDQDWDQLHTDFDQWRSGLAYCAPADADAALRGFAANFAAITRQAAGLPRSANTRYLADIAIAAAQEEEAALRRLRDHWSPGDSTLFEAVDQRRSDSITARTEVLDGIEDLLEAGDVDTEAILEEFDQQLVEINEQWESIHQAYFELRDNRETSPPATIAGNLGDILVDLAAIHESIDGLPEAPFTKNLIRDLRDAAESETEALEALQAEYKSIAGEGPAKPPDFSLPFLPTPTPEPPPKDAGIDPGTNEEGNGEEPPLPDSPSFEDADSQVTNADEARVQVLEKVGEWLEDPPSGEEAGQEDLVKIEEFQAKSQTLTRAWDTFHDGYSQWRATNGDCDVASVGTALAGFSTQLDGLESLASSMPHAPFLQPMTDSLLQAIQREQEGMRVLRSTWQPYSADNYRALDQERANASQLRRQVQVSVQELLARFGVTGG